MNTWHEVTTLEEIPPLGARVVKTKQGGHRTVPHC